MFPMLTVTLYLFRALFYNAGERGVTGRRTRVVRVLVRLGTAAAIPCAGSCVLSPTGWPPVDKWFAPVYQGGHVVNLEEGSVKEKQGNFIDHQIYALLWLCVQGQRLRLVPQLPKLVLVLCGHHLLSLRVEDPLPLQ